MSKYYNSETMERFEDAKIIGGNPSGIINYVRTPHKWAYSIYRLMQSYIWFIGECHVAQDKTEYQKLTDEQKYAYDMALAQLIANDSIQTKQLTDGISHYITSPIVNIALTLQAYTEAEHSVSYTAIAEEICEDVDRIYNLHKYEPMLAMKNEAVENMYAAVNQEGSEPTAQELLVAFAANQILEQLVFPGGFIVLWSFNMTGTNKVIDFIERDETGTHVPLFKNIFRAAVREVGLEESTKEKIINMIKDMTEVEKIWTKHISKDLLGFSDRAVDMYIEYQANSVCKNLNLPIQYEETDGGPLMTLYKKHTLIGKSSTGENVAKKTNFFEAAVADYDKGGLDDDY